MKMLQDLSLLAIATTSSQTEPRSTKLVITLLSRCLHWKFFARVPQWRRADRGRFRTISFHSPSLTVRKVSLLTYTANKPSYHLAHPPSSPNPCVTMKSYTNQINLTNSICCNSHTPTWPIFLIFF